MLHLYDFYISNNIRYWEALAKRHHSYKISLLWPSDEVDSKQLLCLPSGSWILEVEFTLKTPFLSKSEDPVLPLKNKDHEIKIPQHIDRFTGFPEVKPTTWKGNLLHAIQYIEDFKKDEDLMKKAIKPLFGNPEQAGALYYFPTFFRSYDEHKKVIGNDIINPHSRKTGVPVKHGLVNISRIEPGYSGIFRMIFYPWNIPQDEFCTLLHVSIKAVRIMLFDTGFSARKSSGWGIADEEKTKWRLCTHGYQKVKSLDFNLSLFLDESGSIREEFCRKKNKLISDNEFKRRRSEEQIAETITVTAFDKFKYYWRSMGSEGERKFKNIPSKIIILGPLRTSTIFREIRDFEYVEQD